METTEPRSKDSISLVVDNRERCEELFDALGKIDAFDIEIRRLAVGDYLLDNRILFERKTVSDLVGSIKSGRLFNQALRLAEVEHLIPVLILEGGGRCRSRMRWEGIQGALVTLSVFIGLPVLWTRNPADTAKTLCFAGRQSRAVAAGALHRHGWRPKGKKALQNYILQGLPGVGPDRAAGLIDSFGSVRAVMAAQTEDLQAVRGIGVKTADKIDWAVCEEPARWVNGLSCR